VDATSLAGLGAFLSGAGSVLGAIFVIRSMRRRMEKECAEKIRLLKEGIEIAEKIEHDR
jgi:hypothetical protein